MIESIQFVNFKALPNTTLPLGRFTLLVGPNGSGKSTALQAFQALQSPGNFTFRVLASVGLQATQNAKVEIILKWGAPAEGVVLRTVWPATGGSGQNWEVEPGRQLTDPLVRALMEELARVRVYALDAVAIAAPVVLNPYMELHPTGHALAGVLDRLRDQHPERFEGLNEELGRLLPEFDRILFETPQTSHRTFLLRTREGQHAVPATDLSQGTRLAVAILTLAYLPNPPPVVGLEEPDRGIHPRLLRDVRDALYRLSQPEDFGERRQPVQVVATTHSPYFLDLFKDHPEDIVIAQKTGLEARFERLVDRPDIEEILADAPLGDVWYSGVLGGVPSKV